MNINKHNYEAFFLDYHEENLTPQRVADLFLFIEQHPELKEEFENFENFTLKDISSIAFENKSSLRKEITLKNKEEYFIRSVENTLNTTELTLLNNFLKQHPQFLIDFELFKKTKLSIDTAIVFEEKEKLKHRNKKVIPFFYYISAAASILLLFGLFFLFNKNDIKPELAHKENVPQNKPIALIAASKLSTKKNAEDNFVKHKESFAVVVKQEKIKIKNIILEGSSEGSPKEISSLAITYENENKKPLVINKDSLVMASSDLKQTKNDSNVVAQVEKKYETAKPSRFISLPELAVEKIKETLLDKNSVRAQKKSGRLKKINGWDIAQIITRGISKFTGRKVEVKPYYNDEGNVTAYALSAGRFQFSKER